METKMRAKKNHQEGGEGEPENYVRVWEKAMVNNWIGQKNPGEMFQVHILSTVIKDIYKIRKI